MPPVEDLVSWHDAIWIKRSVCHANGVLLIVIVPLPTIFNHQHHPQEVIDLHWSPLYLRACRPDKSRKEAGWPNFGPLVQRPKPSMGCNSCGHIFSGSLQRLCQWGWFRNYKSWGCKMPKIPWPPKQLPLSTSGNWDHWCVWQVHCPIFEWSCKETWCVWQPKGALVAPPVSFPGCGQGKRCQHIGMRAILI